MTISQTQQSMRGGAIFCPSTVSEIKVLHPARKTNARGHIHVHTCSLCRIPMQHFVFPFRRITNLAQDHPWVETTVMPQAPAWLKTNCAKQAGQYGICLTGFWMRTRNLYTFKRRKHMDAFVSCGASVTGPMADSRSHRHPTDTSQ